MTPYRTIAKTAIAEYTDRRSRFIGEIRSVKTETEAAAFLEEIRHTHWDARHHVRAFILRDGNIRRFSDDGEPQGTAGAPVLDVLQKQQLCDAAIVVTRYFGGILLGGGGLVRAYGHTAALAVEAAGIVEMRPTSVEEIVCSYTQYGWLSALIEGNGGTVEDTVYTDTVTVRFSLSIEQQGFFEKQLTERSAGSLSPRIVEERYIPVPVKA